MKRIVPVLLLLASFVATSQGIVPRGSSANTPQDQRLSALLNLFTPRYADTTTANIFPNLGIDTCGAVIYTYNDHATWYRDCNPKRWVSYKYTTNLPDGVYSGGNVTYSGVGLDFIVSPAIYVIGGVVYSSPQKTVTLDPADPAQDRIDDIVLTALPTGADKITGQPGTNQQPSVNPQTQLFRAFVRVPAGSLVPAGITQLMIYDQDLGLPDEWTATNTGGTVNFAATDFPYHLTIYADVTAFTTANSIDFTYSDTVHSYNKGTLIAFVRLASVMPQAVNLNFVLTLGGVPVSNLVNFTSGGMNRNIISQYQGVFIPFPQFGAGDIIFDGIRIVATGAGTVPRFGLDYIQMQQGLTSPQSQNRFAVEDNSQQETRFFNQNGRPFNFNNGKLGFNTPVVPIHTITVGDEVGGNPILYVYGPQGDLVYLESPNDGSSIEVRAKNIINFVPHLGTAGGKMILRADGNANQNISINLYNGGASEPPEGKIGTDLLEAAVSNEFFIKPAHHTGSALPTYLTLYDSIKLRGVQDQSAPDSLVSITGGVVTRTAASAFTGTNIYNSSGSITDPRTVSIGNQSLTFLAQSFRFGSIVNSQIYQDTSKISITAHPYSGFVWQNGITVDTTTITFQNIKTNIIDTVKELNVKFIGLPVSSSSSDSVLVRGSDGRTYLRSQSDISGNAAPTNVGSGFRFVIPFVRQIKTLFGSYAVNIDSSSNTNALTIKLDTALIRAYLGVGGPGSGSVSTFSFSNANGISGVVTNATTTPQLTLSTTVNGLVKANGTSFSAAVAGTDYLTPSGSAALLTSFPTLNQNTTGTAATISGIGTVAHGGTGLATLTPYAVLAGGTTGTGNVQQVSGLGTAGQALVSNGAGALPTWQTIPVSAGVSSLSGTVNRVTVSASTGAITISGPQDIATTSTPTFQRLTLTGAAATANAIISSHTDPAAAAGVFTNNGTRLAFSFATTYKRFALTNDATPGNGQIPIGNGTDYTVSAIGAANNIFNVVNGAGSITLGLNLAPQTLTDGATITWNATNGYNATVTLGGTNRTLNITNPVAGATYTIIIKQDATGNRTIANWPTGTFWQGGTLPVLSTGANFVDVITFYYNGVNYLGSPIGKNYR